MAEELEVKYGLPEKVIFCKNCVMSNQRPSSTREFKHSQKTKHKTMNIDDNGICDACRYAQHKEKINWDDRENQLLMLLDKYRRNDGYFDCIVPSSGGKDSGFAAHILKYKYGMTPLTITWPPIIYTDVGWKNFRNGIDIGGYDNVTFNYNGQIHALLTRLAIENLFHPFQPFILGQKCLPPKMATKFRVPLIFYGENEAEYGNPIAENSTSLRDQSYYTLNNLSDVRLGGISIDALFEKYNLKLSDIQNYLPAKPEELEKAKIEVHYLGYYLKWTPQEAYYYCVENTGFQANPVRAEGSYSKYNSLDDRIDGLHFYTTYIKFGIGRASYEASQEIRNKHLTREEGVALVRRFDGEFPRKYFQEIMNYIGMNSDDFYQLEQQFKSPHLWDLKNNKLRFQVS